MDANRIGSVVEPVLAGHGLELEAVELQPAGKRTVVRIVVDGDGAEGHGPGLDEIAEATQSMSSALDDSDVTGSGSYTLEVSSRGISRPLTKPQHWRRNVDRLVKVTVSGPAADDAEATGGTVTGRITGSTDDEVTLDVDGASRTIAFTDISKALVQVEFNRKDH